MKVFICWSEGRSNKIAEELRSWLKKVIQQVDPWMSDEDIRAGARWHPEITNVLADCKVGVICLTPENLESRWIHFESGALSKTVEKTYVCPYLIGGLELKDIPYPLAQFQAKKADKEGTFDIVKSINSALDKSALPADFLKESFEKWWPDLEKVIKELPAETEAKPKRKADDMMEEILNSVRAISNMISEQRWPGLFISRENFPSRLEDLYRGYRSRAEGAGISGRSTGPIGPSEAIRLAAELISPLASPSASPLPSPSEEPTDDEKKTE